MGKLSVKEALFVFQTPHRLIHTIMHVHKPPEVAGFARSHVRTLMMLKDHGPLCMHRLGDWVGVAKGSFTQVVDKLVEENLAKRERSPEDRRVVILSITKKGREVSRTIDEHFSRHLNEVLRVLNDEEKAAMLDALRTVERTTRIIQERWNAGR